MPHFCATITKSYGGEIIADKTAEITARLKDVSEALDADVYLYSGDISTENVDRLITEARAKLDCKPNVVLLLTTYGGEPDAGYRLTRFLKRFYGKFIVFIFGYCKSAGTLVVLGADEVVMSDFGELGPLDIQVVKQDELTFSSSLSYYEAFSMLQANAYEMFESHFLSLKGKSGGSISTKTAADIATALTIGVLSPIASQIEPLRLGEIGLSSKIALEYGERICDNEAAVFQLATGYPSHSFVIDVEEAEKMLGNVRMPSTIEIALENSIQSFVRFPAPMQIVKRIYPQDTNPMEENNENTACEDQPKTGSDDTQDSTRVEQDTGAENNPEPSVSANARHNRSTETNKAK